MGADLHFPMITVWRQIKTCRNFVSIFQWIFFTSTKLHGDVQGERNFLSKILSNEYVRRVSWETCSPLAHSGMTRWTLNGYVPSENDCYNCCVFCFTLISVTKHILESVRSFSPSGVWLKSQVDYLDDRNLSGTGPVKCQTIFAGSLAQPLAGASQDHPIGRTTGARGTARTKWSLGDWLPSGNLT